jgi:hypothetical protein
MVVLAQRRVFAFSPPASPGFSPVHRLARISDFLLFLDVVYLTSCPTCSDVGKERSEACFLLALLALTQEGSEAKCASFASLASSFHHSLALSPSEGPLPFRPVLLPVLFSSTLCLPSDSRLLKLSWENVVRSQNSRKRQRRRIMAPLPDFARLRLAAVSSLPASWLSYRFFTIACDNAPGCGAARLPRAFFNF